MDGSGDDSGGFGRQADLETDDVPALGQVGLSVEFGHRICGVQSGDAESDFVDPVFETLAAILFGAYPGLGAIEEAAIPTQLQSFPAVNGG